MARPIHTPVMPSPVHWDRPQDKGTSVRAMLLWMRAANWTEFREAMRHYYSPGIH